MTSILSTCNVETKDNWKPSLKFIPIFRPQIMLPDTSVAQCTGIILKVLALESNKTKNLD